VSRAAVVADFATAWLRKHPNAGPHEVRTQMMNAVVGRIRALARDVGMGTCRVCGGEATTSAFNILCEPCFLETLAYKVRAERESTNNPDGPLPPAA